MKLFYSIGIGGALVLLSSAAAAQTAPDAPQQQPSVSIKANELRIELPDHYRKMWPADYRDYIREYSLSNNMTLRVFARGVNMYAALNNNGEWHKIVAAPSNTFIALDRQIKMRINLLDNEEASGEVVMVVPPRRLDDGTLAVASLQSATLR